MIPPARTSTLTTAALPGAAATTPADATAARARVQGELARGDFGALMGLQRRGREAVTRLRAQARELGASPTDPATVARAQQLEHEATALEGFLREAGQSPGSNVRRALGWMLLGAEQGLPLTGADRLRFRLAAAADRGDLSPAAGADLRAAITGLDTAASTTAIAANDPTMVHDPVRLATFRARMSSVSEAGKAIEQLLDAGRVDEQVAARLGAAGRQDNPGHVVRDVLAALRQR